MTTLVSGLVTGVLVALGGALGAALRHLAGLAADRGFPVGTLAVNLVGSAALGLLVASAPADPVLALLGTGVCGGLTTYSAVVVRTLALGPRLAAVYAAATVVGSLAACAGGFWLGAALG